MEGRSGKRSSSAGSEKVERVGDREEKMERYCSTGQSPQRAVATVEEEEEVFFLVCYLALQFKQKGQNRYWSKQQAMKN